jgi:hypothetical protein
MTMQDGIRAVQQAFTQAATPPRWPMYVRQAKQYLRNAIENFDERKYGFASVVDLLRAAGKEGVLRIERDRQGAIRVFPGTNLTPKSATVMEPTVDELEETVVDVQAEESDGNSDGSIEAQPVFEAEPVAEAPIVDADVTPAYADRDDDDDDGDDGQHLSDEDEVNGNVIRPEPKKPVARKRKATASRAPRAARVAKTARPRARKSSR